MYLIYLKKCLERTLVRTATATADHGLIYKCGEGGLPPSPQAIPISVDMTTATAYLHLNSSEFSLSVDTLIAETECSKQL